MEEALTFAQGPSSLWIEEMKRKAFTIGLVAMGLTLAAALPPSYSRIATSGKNFQEYFRDLNQAGNTLNPVERFVFSLVLANTDVSGSQK